MKNKNEIIQLAKYYAKSMYPNAEDGDKVANEAFVSFIAGYLHSSHPDEKYLRHLVATVLQECNGETYMPSKTIVTKMIAIADSSFNPDK